MLSDEEIQVMFKQTMGSVSDFHSFRFDFARAVESAVLRKAVETAGKAWLSHRPCSLCNDAGYKAAISALQGRWKP